MRLPVGGPPMSMNTHGELTGAIASGTGTPREGTPAVSLRERVEAWLDGGAPLAMKIALPVIAVIALFVVGYLAVALPALQRALDEQSIAEAGQVATAVQDEYAGASTDATAFAATLRNHVRFDPSITRITVDRVTAGSPVPWAASDGSASANAPADPSVTDAIAARASAHRIRSVDGARILDTAFPIIADGQVVATIGISTRLDAVDATAAVITRLVVIATIFGAAAEVVLIGLIVQLVVLRPIGQVNDAARRVAAGDLSVRVPGGSRRVSRDAIGRVAGDFDDMVAAIAARTAQADAVASRLHEDAVSLERSHRELEVLYQQQSRFVSVVSHDFRTPLTTIQGFSEVLGEEELTVAEVREFARDINLEARRLAAVITDLLDLDRLRSGQLALRLQAVNVDALVREVVAGETTIAAEHSIVLELDAARTSVPGDRDWLARGLVGLLSNAAKYSPRGGVIQVTTDVREGAVHVAVRDHGVGIPPDQLGRIFESDGRVEHAGAGKAGGSVLALPMVREIVRLHRGSIWAESVLDEGSTVHMRVPLTTAETAAEELRS